MMKNKTKSALVAESGHIRVLTIQQKRFVVGLTWQTIRDQRNPMKEIKRVGKAQGLDLVAVRHSDSIQAGFAPKTRLRLRGSYSLSVALASLLDGCCIAVVPLGENPTGVAQYTLVGKTERGGIHPWSDQIYTGEKLLQTIIDLRDELRGSKSDLDVKVYGDTSIPGVTTAFDIKDVLTRNNLRKDFRLRPLTWGMTRGQLIAAGAATILVLSGLMVYWHFEAEREAEARAALQREIARQEALNKEARYQAALQSFRHPWTENPSVTTFIRHCQDMKDKVPVSISGWMSVVVVCTNTGVAVQSVRRTNSAATTAQYVAAVQKLFDVMPVFNFQDSSQTSFSLTQTLPPEGDDPMLPVSERLIGFISLFQSLNIDLSVNAVQIKDVAQNNAGENLPLQDWQEYQFSAETDVPPLMIFKDSDYTGIRLSEITTAVNTSDGSVRYKITGSLYGKR
ncbi:type 4b pilus protein PilO2 [Erwinia tasmaniensis]|uniref:Type IV pilus protein n=1 Tax=Erwinia tasmaniensis (strain DSM 17950 / CFBP 7177 / CIP 109463 / NCPPB 4357 / Et1/99) TaxID=465817 RepID=B2VAV9_ERWT9|nr:type 4b pilus protein PilO2 [Erwinia tasmaniensis]CAO94862.1 Type IV pilus protein [Erwinia tasmaniensis Et1/99]